MRVLASATPLAGEKWKVATPARGLPSATTSTSLTCDCSVIGLSTDDRQRHGVAVLGDLGQVELHLAHPAGALPPVRVSLMRSAAESLAAGSGRERHAARRGEARRRRSPGTCRRLDRAIHDRLPVACPVLPVPRASAIVIIITAAVNAGVVIPVARRITTRHVVAIFRLCRRGRPTLQQTHSWATGLKPRQQSHPEEPVRGIRVEDACWRRWP